MEIFAVLASLFCGGIVLLLIVAAVYFVMTQRKLVSLDELCKNVKLEDVVFTKGWNAQGYSYYLCQYIISLKCSKMKALKYHTYGFRLDTNLGWSDRWFDYPPSFLDKYN